MTDPASHRRLVDAYAALYAELKDEHGDDPHKLDNLYDPDCPTCNALHALYQAIDGVLMAPDETSEQGCCVLCKEGVSERRWNVCEQCLDAFESVPPPVETPASHDSLDWNRLASGDHRALDPAHQWAFDIVRVSQTTTDTRLADLIALMTQHVLPVEFTEAAKLILRPPPTTPGEQR